MIGKIVKGTSFSGCVNYVLKEDKSRLLKAVGVYAMVTNTSAPRMMTTSIIKPLV